MISLNLDALNNIENLLGDSSGDGQYYYLRAAELPENTETVIRILMPKPIHDNGAGGFWFARLIEHWFQLSGREKRVKVISPESFYGVDSCIIEETKMYLAKNNPTAAKMFVEDRTNYKNAIYSKQLNFTFPCLILDNVKTDNRGTITSYTVRNNKVCLFQCPQGLLKDINAFFVSPFRQRPSGKSIADPETGFSLSIRKTMSNKKVHYKADLLPTEHSINDSGTDWEEGVDVELFFKRQLYADSYIESVLTHFLTGKGILEDIVYRHPELREPQSEEPSGDFKPIQLPKMGQPKSEVPATKVEVESQPSLATATTPEKSVADEVKSEPATIESNGTNVGMIGQGSLLDRLKSM